MKLNLGCGNHYAEGWTNVDVASNDDVCPDVVADITEPLPFDDGAATRIYLGHVLEHLDRVEIAAVLAECRRVLEAGGTMCIVGPDCDRADVMLRRGEIDAVEHELVVSGAGRWAGDVHLWRCTETEIIDALTATGWRPWRVGLMGLRPTWPLVSGVAWQFAVQAVPA